MSPPPACAAWIGFLVGKLVDCVSPVTYAFLDESTAMLNPKSPPDPPRYVEYTCALPAAFILVTNESKTPPACAAWIGFLVGKLVDRVLPVTYALSDESTAMSRPLSKPDPPRYVEYTSALPAAFILVTNASLMPPAFAAWIGFLVGKFTNGGKKNHEMTKLKP